MILYNIISRYGYPPIVIVNGGSKFKKEAIKILKRLRDSQVKIVLHNIKVNRITELMTF